MDPRGVGLSTRVRCDPAAYNRPVSLFPRTAAQFRRLAHYDRALGRSCRKRTGPLLGHVDTLSVARDMEALRRALADGKLNFLGLSYGAEIGALYAERYPKRIRTIALDGILDHSIPIGALFADDAVAYEDTFNRFAAWCAQTADCALHGRDVGALFDRLVEQADQRPIPVPGCPAAPCPAPVTGGDIRLNAYNLLLFKDPVPAFGVPGWNGLAQALAALEAGDAGAFTRSLATRPRDGTFAGLAVICLDYPPLIHSFRDLRAAGCSLARSPRTPTAPARRGPPSPAASTGPPDRPTRRTEHESTAPHRSCSQAPHTIHRPHTGGRTICSTRFPARSSSHATATATHPHCCTPAAPATPSPATSSRARHPQPTPSTPTRNAASRTPPRGGGMRLDREDYALPPRRLGVEARGALATAARPQAGVRRRFAPHQLRHAPRRRARGEGVR